jgi:predicted GTPase
MTEKLKIQELLKELNLSEEKRLNLEKNMNTPVKIIGIGQAGVGKSELLKSIFRINEKSVVGSPTEVIEIMKRLKTGAVKSVTKDFFSFQIKSEEGFLVQLTDGPGLGESRKTEEKYLKMWIDEIPQHDMLYWVLDGSNRDIGHIQENMKYILDKTNYRNKLIIVLNKIDQILLPIEMELKGVVGWDLDYNQPTKSLLNLISERTNDIIEKLVDYVDINKEQIVICSARKRWNHGKVLDKIIEFVPDNIKIKVSKNREVKDATELMSIDAKLKIK